VERLPGEVTVMLSRANSGDQDALAELIPLVYRELRRLAGHVLREERAGHTLQPTALVHEAYLVWLVRIAPAGTTVRISWRSPRR